ncbi:MAG TPA: hypothetical protein VGN01_12790 [Acidobacteriaceae bacterium]
MSAALVLPYVYAFARPQAELKAPISALETPEPTLAFYRKYTEAILRRYVRISMEVGKVPAMLKEEMFRGKVSSYRVTNFDDSIIFLVDVECCLKRLDDEQQNLIAHITMEAYTPAETAELLRIPVRTAIRRYGVALDRLTRVFIDVKLLHTPNCVKR